MPSAVFYSTLLTVDVNLQLAWFAYMKPLSNGVLAFHPCNPTRFPSMEMHGFPISYIFAFKCTTL